MSVKVHRAQRTVSAMLAENVARALWAQLRDMFGLDPELPYSYAWTQVNIDWFDAESGERTFKLNIFTPVSNLVSITVTMHHSGEGWIADSASWEHGGSTVFYKCLTDQYGQHMLYTD